MGSNNTSGVLSLTVPSGGYAVFELAAEGGDSDGALAGTINFINTLQTGGNQLAHIRGRTDGSTSADRGGSLAFSTKADGGSTPSERMRINEDGTFGLGSVGQTNVGVAIDLSPSASTLKVTNLTDDYQSINIWSVLNTNTNDADCNFYAGYGQGAHRYFVAGNGNVTNVNNSYGAISDINLKENISDASSQWDDIKGVRVRKFSFKSDNLDKANMIGVVAQEIETVSPNLVEDKNKLNDILEITDTDKTITDESGNVIDNPNYGKPKPNPDFGLHIDGETYKTVKYSVLYMKAIKALQEAMERIETLETSNADLIKRVKTLEDA